MISAPSQPPSPPESLYAPPSPLLSALKTEATPLVSHSIKQLHTVSPLVFSPVLSAQAGANVFLKLETTQPSGSFKTRGIGHLCLSLYEENKRLGKEIQFVISSGGNAGLACAYSAKALNCQCTVFVPTTIPQSVIQRLKIFGASVVVHGAALDEAREGAEQFVQATPDSVYIPPFDHAKIVEGHSSLMHELSSQLYDSGYSSPPDAIICSVGGGGLLGGVLKGAKELGWKDTSILACETDGAASLANTLRCTYYGGSGKAEIRLPVLEEITTIAASLGSKSVSRQCMDLVVGHEGGVGKVVSVVMGDPRTVQAIRSYADDHATLIEPACAASLVPIYYPQILRAGLPHLSFPPIPDLSASVSDGSSSPRPTLRDAPVIVVIVCGGNTCSLKRLADWERDFEDIEGGDVKLFEGTLGLDLVL